MGVTQTGNTFNKSDFSVQGKEGGVGGSGNVSVKERNRKISARARVHMCIKNVEMMMRLCENVVTVMKSISRCWALAHK